MPQSSDIAISSQKSRIGKAGDRIDNVLSGEYIARLFKYYRQQKEPSKNFSPVPLNRISARKFYSEHKRTFDAVAEFFVLHRIDPCPYIMFFINDLCKSGSDIETELMSKKTFLCYIAKVQAAEKRAKIWKWFQKSVLNIVDICLKNDYMSGKDCLLALIKNKKIAYEFLTGRISKYFFAAMPGFREMIPKLDHFARDEFKDLYDKFDIYNTEINETFLTYRNRMANPLVLVDSELTKRKKTDTVRKDDDLFDPSID